MSSTSDSKQPTQQFVSNSTSIPIILNDYEALSTNCTMVGSNNLPLDTTRKTRQDFNCSPKKVQIANNGFIRSGNSTFRLHSPTTNLSHMSFGGNSDLNSTQIQKVIVSGAGSTIVTGSNVGPVATSVVTMATNQSPSTIFQSIPTVIAAAANSTTPNLVQIIQAPSSTNQTYQTHQILARPTIVAPSSSATSVLKIKSPLNILPKPTSILTIPVSNSTSGSNQMKTSTGANINSTQPVSQQATSIILTNQGAQQTIIPSSGGTILLNQIPLILQQNGGSGVQFVLKQNTNSQPQIISPQTTNVTNKISSLFPASSPTHSVQQNHSQGQGPTHTLVIHRQPNQQQQQPQHQQQTTHHSQPQQQQQQQQPQSQQNTTSNQQPQQVVRLVAPVGSNGVMQQLTTPTFIAVNNTTINNNLTTINKNPMSSEPLTMKTKQKQSGSKKKKKSTSVFKETKLDLANIMKLSGIDDDDGFLDVNEPDKLADTHTMYQTQQPQHYQQPQPLIKCEPQTNTASTSSTHITPTNIVFDSNQMSQPTTTIIDPNNGTLLNVLPNSNFTIQNGFLTSQSKPITSQQIVINPSPILTLNNNIPQATNNISSRISPSGGYKLLLNEEGRFVLQHDPNLNQDLQSQLFLQNLFGNLNSGANNPLLQSLLSNIQQLQQNQKLAPPPQPPPQPQVIMKQSPCTTTTTTAITTTTMTTTTTPSLKKSPYVLSLTMDQLETLKKEGQLTVNGQVIYMQGSTSTSTSTTTVTTATTTTTTPVAKTRKKVSPDIKKGGVVANSAVTKGPILHTIQITTAQEQMLKSIQGQIDVLNDRLRKEPKVCDGEKETISNLLKNLYTEQQKILASGGVIDSNNGCNTETFTAALNNLQNSKICFQNCNNNSVPSAAAAVTNSSNTRTSTNSLVTTKDGAKSRKSSVNEPLVSDDVVVKTEIKEEPVSLFDLVKSTDVRKIDLDKSANIEENVNKDPPISQTNGIPDISIIESKPRQTKSTPVPSNEDIADVPSIQAQTSQALVTCSSTANSTQSSNIVPLPSAASPIPLPQLESQPEQSKINLAEIAQNIDERFLSDQQNCINVDYNSSFKNTDDAVTRLMRYHCFNQPVLSQKDLDKADEIFEMTAVHFLNKHQSMVNKYRYLLLKESMKEVPTSELMMIGRLLNAEEQLCLNRERLEAEQRSNEDHCKKRSSSDTATRIEYGNKRVHLDENAADDDLNNIDEQVQSAIDSILNLQQKSSETTRSHKEPHLEPIEEQSLRRKIVIHDDHSAVDKAVRSILS